MLFKQDRVALKARLIDLNLSMSLVEPSKGIYKVIYLSEEKVSVKKLELRHVS